MWCNEKHKSPIYFDFEQRSNAPLSVGAWENHVFDQEPAVSSKIFSRVVKGLIKLNLYQSLRGGHWWAKLSAKLYWVLYVKDMIDHKGFLLMVIKKSVWDRAEISTMKKLWEKKRASSLLSPGNYVSLLSRLFSASSPMFCLRMWFQSYAAWLSIKFFLVNKTSIHTLRDSIHLWSSKTHSFRCSPQNELFHVKTEIN